MLFVSQDIEAMEGWMCAGGFVPFPENCAFFPWKCYISYAVYICHPRFVNRCKY